MNKMLAALFAASLFFAPLALTSCDHSPEDEEETAAEEVATTEDSTKEYTGDELVTFLGIGTKNSDGDVEITPNGYDTGATLGTALTVSTLKSITVNAKIDTDGYKGVIKFTDWHTEVYTADITSTTLSNYAVDGISACTAEKLSGIQPFVQDSNGTATTDKTITIHSITIVTTE